MTLLELWDQLNQHDWFYQYSDDIRVYRAGNSDRERLSALSKTIPGGPELLEAFTKHHFSGEPWSTPKAPKPPRPEGEGGGAAQ